MKRTIVVAIGENYVIGKDNDLIWHMPADLAHFVRVTKGKHVLMGRKSFESLGKPLPKRVNIVITRQEDYAAEGIVLVGSLDAALDYTRDAGQEEAIILGGAQIYKQSLERDLVDEMIITEIKASFEGDAHFPEFDKSRWVETKRLSHKADERNPYDYDFVWYTRKKDA